MLSYIHVVTSGMRILIVVYPLQGTSGSQTRRASEQTVA